MRHRPRCLIAGRQKQGRWIADRLEPLVGHPKHTEFIDRAKPVLDRPNHSETGLGSPSKYKTASTMCSSTRGPASAPSLVTCRPETGPRHWTCHRVRAAAVSRTWLTEPGALPISSENIVWMESMTTMRGLAEESVRESSQPGSRPESEYDRVRRHPAQALGSKGDLTHRSSPVT